MAIPAYMTIDGIEGGVQIAGREGTIEVIGFDHELRIPTDSMQGAITATRKHEPLVVTKGFDKASPYLYEACANGTTLPTIEILWYEINTSGEEVAYFSHIIEGVKITNVTPKMHNCKDIDFERFPHLESVAFKYDTIHWTYLDGNLKVSDSWTTIAR
ncbi:MAG: type VI secretion system tube protein TssD [Gammaproteobacteria bacterium]